MLHALLHSIIRSATGRFSRVLATIAMGVAMLLIVLAVQLQANFQSLLNSPANKDSIANFLVIHQSSDLLQKSSKGLSPETIADLRKQDFTESVGIIESSRFKAGIESPSELFPFYTDIAFEAVADSFLDIRPEQWQWTEESHFIPLIVPNLFLDIYNFQFALSQGLPQLSTSAIQQVPLVVKIETPAGAIKYTGRIVGFSDRIASVLVPQSFMQWANQAFGNGNNDQVSRVVLRTKDPGNPALSNYLKEHGLKTDADKTRFSKYRKIVDIVAGTAGAIGLILLLFALLVFSLFIRITIATAKSDIELLLTLGLSPKALSRFLMRKFFPVQLILMCLIILLLTAGQYSLSQWLASQQINLPAYPAPMTLLCAAAVLLVIFFTNRQSIQNYVHKHVQQ